LSVRPDACSTARSKPPAWIASISTSPTPSSTSSGRRAASVVCTRRRRNARSKPVQWIEGEIAAVKPHVIVALGATAAKALIGPQFKVSVQRGQFVESPLAPYVFATFHPSALLRLRDDDEKEAAFATLVKDLKLIQKALGRP
jgi:uracil-DNA glycosylase